MSATGSGFLNPHRPEAAAGNCHATDAQQGVSVRFAMPGQGYRVATGLSQTSSDMLRAAALSSARMHACNHPANVRMPSVSGRDFRRVSQ